LFGTNARAFERATGKLKPGALNKHHSLRGWRESTIYQNQQRDGFKLTTDI
jgi:hypothetical protein